MPPALPVVADSVRGPTVSASLQAVKVAKYGNLCVARRGFHRGFPGFCSDLHFLGFLRPPGPSLSLAYTKLPLDRARAEEDTEHRLLTIPQVEKEIPTCLTSLMYVMVRPTMAS